MTQSNNTRFSGQSPCATDNHSALPSATDYYRQIGLPLQKHGDDHLAPCPWAGGQTCPTHGTVRVDPETGAFCCSLCASDGGDTLTYHQLANRQTYAQALDLLTTWEG